MRYAHQSLSERVSHTLRARSTLSFACSYNLLLWRMELLQLLSFKELRPPRLQFLPTVAGFSLLCLLSPFVTVYCTSSYVSLVFLLYTLAFHYLGSLPLLVVKKIINLNDTKHEKLNGYVKNKSSPPFNPEGSVCIFVCWQVKDYFLHHCTFWKGKWMRINLSTTLQAIFCIFCIKQVIAAVERA